MKQYIICLIVITIGVLYLVLSTTKPVNKIIKLTIDSRGLTSIIYTHYGDTLALDDLSSLELKKIINE